MFLLTVSGVAGGACRRARVPQPQPAAAAGAGAAGAVSQTQPARCRLETCRDHRLSLRSAYCAVRVTKCCAHAQQYRAVLETGETETTDGQLIQPDV